MSFNNKSKLRTIAKYLCRDLRKNATQSEKIIWEIVRNRKLNDKKIYRQYPIFYDLMGIEKFFIADFYCHESKLVIEIDGAYHQLQKEYDEKRTEIITLLGVEVIRFSNDEVKNKIDSVVERILEKL